MKNKFAATFIITFIFSLFIFPVIQNQGSTAMAKEVKWGCFTDLTGPIAVTANRMWEGFKGYIQWMEEDHPIPGVKIKLLWEDTGYSVPRYITAYKKFKNNGMIIAYNTSTTADVSLHSFFAKDKIPCLSPGGLASAMWPPSFTFSNKLFYPDLFATASIYFMDEWKKKGKTEKPKAMFITWDNPFGRGPVDLGTPWAVKYGYDMLPPQFFSSARPTDLTLQLSKAKEMGANLVFINSLASHFAVLVKNAQKLGLLDKIQFCGAELSHSDYQIEILGDAAEGVWCTSAPASWPNKSKGYEMIVEAFKKQGKTFKGMDTILGVSWARIGSEAIRAAAKKVGPENVTSVAVYDALINMKDMDMWGLIPNVSYSPDSRIPFEHCYVHEVQNGVWKDIAHIRVPLLAPKY